MLKKIKGAAHMNGNVDSKCKRSFTLLSPKNINFFANDFPFRHPKYSNNGSHCSPAAVWLVAELRLVRPAFFCTFGNLRRYFLQPNNTAPVSAKHYYKTIVLAWLESSKTYRVHPLYQLRKNYEWITCNAAFPLCRYVTKYGPAEVTTFRVWSWEPEAMFVKHQAA